MSTHPSFISVRNVGCTFTVRKGFFSFKEYEALKNVSFDIYQGETLGIIGRNGAGKSTLLRLLSSIILPNSGSISRPEKLSVSLLSLQAGFDLELSGRMNAILSGMLLGFSKSAIEARLDGIAQYAELEAFFDSPLKTYSTGMRARLGFAVGMELSPDVLLVDEVLGVGDTEFRKKAVETMKSKMRSEQTVVFVSHDMHTVKTLCDRVVWVEDGVTRLEGAAEDVVATYLSLQNVTSQKK